jgi:hypothetical protein
MRPAGNRSSISLYPEPRGHHLGSSPRFLLKARLPTNRGNHQEGWCSLATEVSISVLPPRVEAQLQVVVQPLQGWAGRRAPDWCGIPCRIGYFILDFPVDSSPAPIRCVVWVRVPERSETWMPDYLLLGTHFLRHYRAEVSIELGRVNYARRLTQPCGRILI